MFNASLGIKMQVLLVGKYLRWELLLCLVNEQKQEKDEL